MLQDSSIDISLTEENCIDCIDEYTQGCTKKQHCASHGDEHVMIPGNMTDVQIHNHLSHLNDTKIWTLHLHDFLGDDAKRAFGGFESEEKNHAFSTFLKNLVQDWCCRMPEEAINTTQTESIRILPGLFEHHA